MVTPVISNRFSPVCHMYIFSRRVSGESLIDKRRGVCWLLTFFHVCQVAPAELEAIMNNMSIVRDVREQLIAPYFSF